ncbi:MAG: IPT/TIG domain-containing protein [Candidatus Pacebacteria bacterium]|nr:IPT/TIG domain-containing protein [Candidatus Paceibacterota bacterium]
MKKYTLYLSIFTLFLILIGLLSFNTKLADAYDSGCIGNALYSITTGQLCSVSSYDYSNYGYGCTSAGPYNIITGQLCSGSQYGYSNYSYGCTSDGPFNIITGQLCSGATSQYPYTYPYYNQVPVISGISGPQSLNVNQMGTWTVRVSNSNLYSGNLTYSVNWGDQPIYVYGVNSSYIYPPQQSATFTHTYMQAGTYNPTFTVTNSSGQSASSSLSVVVGGYTSSTPPFISSISTSSGRVGTQVTIYGTGFNNNYASNNAINFGMSIIPNAYSSNNTSMTFTVPTYTNSACLYSTPACVIPQYQIIPGTYPIFVTNTNGISNVVYFTVTY